MTAAAAEIARTRQGLHRFLGEALQPPTPARFDLLSSAASVLDTLDIDSFAFSPQWRRFRRRFPVQLGEAELDSDYVRLFASGRSGALAPPTESYYRVPAKGGGIAAFTAELQREYQRVGIGLDRYDDPPDHVSVQLQGMSQLCGLEARGWSGGDSRAIGGSLSRQHWLLTHHLRVWIPQFRQRVKEAPPSVFYIDLIDALHAFVVHETDYVGVVRKGLPES